MSKTSRTISSREKKAPGTPSESSLTSPAPARPSEQEVATLAYQRWVDRGCPMGHPEEDWFQAEHELQSGHRSS